MSRRRLLDAAAMFKAARGLASECVALQRHQLDIYSKTSSLTKAVRYQTGRGTLKAGAGLARAANSGQDSKRNAPGKGTPVPSQASTNGGKKQVEKKQVEKKSSLEQDHFYTKSDTNTTAQPLSGNQLGVKQEKGMRYPLADGSITPAKSDFSVPKRDQESFEPAKIGAGEDSLTGQNNGTTSDFQSVLHSGTSIPESGAKAVSNRAHELQRELENQIPSVSAEPPNTRLQPETTPIGLEPDVFYTRSSKATRVLPSLPGVKLPEITGDTQGGDCNVSDDKINQDVFYSAPSKNQHQPVPEVQAVPEQEQPSDDVYSEIFHSPRVAKLLKGERKQNNAVNGLKLRAVQDTPVEQAKLSQVKDQELFHTRPTGQEPSRTVDSHNVTKEPSQSKEADAADAHHLAEAMAQDVANTSSTQPEVSIQFHLSRKALADKLTVTL